MPTAARVILLKVSTYSFGAASARDAWETTTRALLARLAQCWSAPASSARSRRADSACSGRVVVGTTMASALRIMACHCSADSSLPESMKTIR